MNTYANTRFCNFCNSANATARITTYNSGFETVTEAKYICPRCNNLVASVIVDRKPNK